MLITTTGQTSPGVGAARDGGPAARRRSGFRVTSHGTVTVSRNSLKFKLAVSGPRAAADRPPAAAAAAARRRP